MSQFLLVEDVEQIAYEQMVNPPEGIPLPWWNRTSSLMGGLRMNEFSVLTAPTGAGKTTFLANLVCQAITQGMGAYICSAEIGSAGFLIAMYSSLDKKTYGNGDKWTPLEVQIMQAKYKQLLRSGRLLFSKHDDKIDPQILIEEMQGAVRFGAKLVILDNLQFFMPIVESNRERQAMDLTIREFARFVRKQPAHCMLIAHPRKGAVDSEDAMKGSSTLPQEADNVLAMQRIDAETAAKGNFQPTDRRLTFFKLRKRGWNYGKSVYFEFNGGAYVEKTVEWKGQGVGL